MGEDVDIESLWDDMGKDLSTALPLLPYWLDRVAKNFALSVSLLTDTHREAQRFGKHLNLLAGDSRYSILKRMKQCKISLVVSSKNYDYALIGDKWNMDCKACEMDLYGWETGDRAWD